jgi:hypothetical protein
MTQATTRSSRSTTKRTAVNPDSVPWDEEEDERPRGKQRDDYDDDDDDDEEETPRRRKSSRPSLSDDEPIRRGKKPTRASEEDEEDIDEEGEETIVFPVQKGHPSADRGRGPSMYFKWDDEGSAQVIKFLDDLPWNFLAHWVRSGNRQSVPCMETKDCPLCKIGVEQSLRIVYPILNMSIGTGDGIVQALIVNKGTDDILAGYNSGKTTGPLTKLWYGASRTKAAKKGQFQTYAYKFEPIKERDLEEDWEIPLEDADEALKHAKPLDIQKVMGKLTRRAMQEIADELMDR